jgi:cytidylate kinase
MARGIEGLVEKNVVLATVRERSGAPRAGERSEEARWPVITVSREPAAGGSTLARAVAERLGFACWDQELLARIAEQSAVVESVLAAVDERVSSSVHEFVRSLVVGDGYGQDEYRANLTKVMGSIALAGAAVVVGRGGQFILGAERALRVRVVCPRDERARRLAARDGLSEAEAARRVRDLGASIATFMRHHFGQDVTDPHHYDVIVNSGTLSLDAATELVIGAYRAKFGALPVGLPRRSESSPAMPSVAPPSSARPLTRAAPLSERTRGVRTG